jgi:hypothetical protein
MNVRKKAFKLVNYKHVPHNQQAYLKKLHHYQISRTRIYLNNIVDMFYVLKVGYIFLFTSNHNIYIYIKYNHNKILSTIKEIRNDKTC